MIALVNYTASNCHRVECRTRVRYVKSYSVHCVHSKIQTIQNTKYEVLTKPRYYRIPYRYRYTAPLYRRYVSENFKNVSPRIL